MTTLLFILAGTYTPPRGDAVDFDLSPLITDAVFDTCVIASPSVAGGAISATGPATFTPRYLHSETLVHCELSTTIPAIVFYVQPATSITALTGIIRPVIPLGIAECSSASRLPDPAVYTNPVLLIADASTATSGLASTILLRPEYYKPHRRVPGVMILSSAAHELCNTRVINTRPSHEVQFRLDLAFDTTAEHAGYTEIRSGTYVWQRASVVVDSDVTERCLSDIVICNRPYRFVVRSIGDNDLDVLHALFRGTDLLSHANWFWRHSIDIDVDVESLTELHRTWFLTYVVPRWIEKDFEIVSGKKYYDLRCGHRYIPPNPPDVNFDMTETSSITSKPSELVFVHRLRQAA